MKDYILDIGIRILILSLALILSFIFVNKAVKPNFLASRCLIDSENCVNISLYKYKNTFIGQIKPSDIWIWYNGHYLYIYGESSGDCQTPDKYEPVNVYTISVKDGVVQFTRLVDQCITILENVKTYYINTLKVKVNNISIYNEEEKQVLNIFNVINYLVKNGYLTIYNK